MPAQNGPASYGDFSVASATGASQTLLPVNRDRRALMIANPGPQSWWINPSGQPAAANTAGSIELAPGDLYAPRVPPSGALTGVGPAGAPLTVKEA
jgi:hypothetical protein